jgi:hypothetical protein
MTMLETAENDRSVSLQTRSRTATPSSDSPDTINVTALGGTAALSDATASGLLCGITLATADSLMGAPKPPTTGAAHPRPARTPPGWVSPYSPAA